MQQHKIPLPIDNYIEGIMEAYTKNSTLIIKASPGSGKTTRLPWAIAKKSKGKVLVLEPRRLAAKLAAQRIAYEEGFILGEEVGYQFRFEKKLNENTQLIFYTEGTFLKKLLSDPHLKDIEAVILDEFHERHLETDLALAYLRSVQKFNHNLKIILMSATLDVKAFPGAEAINIEANLFPVNLHYLPNQPSVLNLPLEIKIKDALEKNKGDTLIFLPGMREILKVRDFLGTRFGETHILHSEIEKEDQEAVLLPSVNRKIILSTNIAESSITIPGITCVIDSGIQREAHFSPWNGLKVVSDRPVTKASAIQRAGRAGRTAPGECFRLYSQFDFQEREEFNLPEINRADLLGAFLLSLQFNLKLNWFESPPQERWENASRLAHQLGLIENDKLTFQGEKVLQLPVEPRLAKVILAGERLKKDEKFKLINFIIDLENDPGLLRKKLKDFLIQDGDQVHWEKAVLAGFIDQLSIYRSKQHDFIHYSGKVIKAHHSLSSMQDGFYLILDITQKHEAIKVLPIEESWPYDLMPFPFTEEVIISDDFKRKTMTKIGSLVIDEHSTPLEWNDMSFQERKKLIEISKRNFEKLFEKFQKSDIYGRFHFWAKINHKLEKLIPPSLESYFEQAPILNFEDVDSYFENVLRDSLIISDIDKLLPKSIHLGGRKELLINYSLDSDPYLEAPIQDFYGLKSTPLIAHNFPLTLKLLGPHKRPLQVTKDLTGFWKKTYQEMKKELQRDYPKHHWPDDPQNSKPVLLKSHLKK